MPKYPAYLLKMHKVELPEPSPIRRKPRKPDPKQVKFCQVCAQEPAVRRGLCMDCVNLVI